MAEISTQQAKFGDTDDTLIYKAAVAAQALAGIVNDSEIRTQTPQIGQTNSNLLRLAYALQQL